MSLKRIHVIGLLLLPLLGVAPTVILCANAKTIESMSASIDSLDQLPAERRILLTQIVDESLSNAPQLDPDKEKNAGRQLTAFLEPQATVLSYMTKARYGVFLQQFRWNLQNFVALPAVKQDDRDRAKKILGSEEDAMNKFINDSYVDTPPEVKKQIAVAVRKQLVLSREDVGNYFFPEFLYPQQSIPKNDEIIAALKQQPFMDNAKKYAAVQDILDDKKVDPGSAQGHVKFFVTNEAKFVYMALTRISDHWFAMPQEAVKNYVNPPKELEDALKRARDENNDRPPGQPSEAASQPRVAHDDAVQKLIEGSGLRISEGVLSETSTSSPAK